MFIRSMFRSFVCAAAHASATLTGLAQAGTPLPDPASVTSLTVRPSITPPKQAGLPVYLDKSSGKWVLSISPLDLRKPSVERLKLHAWDGTVWLDASLPSTPSVAELKRGPGKGNRYECYVGLLATAERKEGDYNVCSSAFIKGDTDVGEAIIGGLSAILGSPRKMMAIDVDALAAAVAEADVAAYALQLRREGNEQWLTRYRSRFEGAKTIADWERFINTASFADPDDLVPVAQQRLTTLRQEEAMRQQRAAVEERERREQAEAARRQRQVDEEVQRLSWVKKLKVGDDTFCGPVIELRPPMIRIAVRAQLQGFSSEQWLREDEVHLPGRGCLNRNGRLTPYNE